MIVVRLDSVGVQYGSEPVFSGLSWGVQDGRVTGLVGPNGCGKSTLLKLIYGQLAPSEGSVIVTPRSLRIGYLAQEPHLDGSLTVFSAVQKAAVALNRVQAELEEVEASLADPQVYTHDKRLAEVLDRQDQLLRDYNELGGPGFDGHLRNLLHDLGFAEVHYQVRVHDLSGGQRKLLGLAQIMINKPDLLLLDEPDNHLDLQGKALLERFVRAYSGGVVIVSHDRYLLDLIADEIVELESGTLTHFPGNYSEYAYEKQTRMLRQQQLYQAQQKEITRLEQSAKRLLTWGKVYDNEKFITRGKNILKRIERIEVIERPELEKAQMGLALSGWRGSNKVLEIEDLWKTFPPSSPTAPEYTIFRGLDLLIRHGERVGLVGRNGSGKSLLFRIILEQEQAQKGEIRIGPSVTTGYYAQQHEILDYERSLIETIRWAVPYSESRAVAFLNKFLFTYEQQRGLVGELSGGERSRLQLALLMLSGANFLLLDEPTNNLDIASAEVLEDALAAFEGSVLVISHDRYFLDRVVGRIVELDGGKMRNFSGNYSDYIQQKGALGD